MALVIYAFRDVHIHIYPNETDLLVIFTYQIDPYYYLILYKKKYWRI